MRSRDRPRTPHDDREVPELFRAQAAGEPEGPVVVRYDAHLAKLAVPEWQATLTALRQLPQVGSGGPVGYFGLNTGTAMGVPLVAEEPRITTAVFGQHWPDALADAARRITVPVEFDMQWHDEHTPHEARAAAVRRLRLEGQDAARERRQAQGVGPVRSRQRGPVLRTAPRPEGHLIGRLTTRLGGVGPVSRPGTADRRGGPILRLAATDHRAGRV